MVPGSPGPSPRASGRGPGATKQVSRASRLGSGASFDTPPGLWKDEAPCSAQSRSGSGSNYRFLGTAPGDCDLGDIGRESGPSMRVVLSFTLLSPVQRLRGLAGSSGLDLKNIRDNRIPASRTNTEHDSSSPLSWTVFPRNTHPHTPPHTFLLSGASALLSPRAAAGGSPSRMGGGWGMWQHV